MRISRIYLQINNIKRIIRARAVINDITYTTTMPVIVTNGPNNAFNGIFKFVSCSERVLRFPGSEIQWKYTIGMYCELSH